MDQQELMDNLKRHDFYHVIQLGENISTSGETYYIPQQELVQRQLNSIDVKGKRVLDIGCRDGLFSFEAERRGAAEVIGVDNALSKGATEFLIPYLKSKVKMYEMNLYDIKPETFGTFDVIIFAGVLYHLRYPFYALKIIRELLNPGGQLILETAVLRAWERYPFLYCPVGSDSPYEPTSVTFFNTPALLSTLSDMGFKVSSTDYLYSRKIFSTKGANLRRYLIACGVNVQRVIPNLVYTIARRFIVDRAAIVCSYKPELLNSENQKYWESTHTMHS